MPWMRRVIDSHADLKLTVYALYHQPRDKVTTFGHDGSDFQIERDGATVFWTRYRDVAVAVYAGLVLETLTSTDAATVSSRHGGPRLKATS